MFNSNNKTAAIFLLLASCVLLQLTSQIEAGNVSNKLNSMMKKVKTNWNKLQVFPRDPTHQNGFDKINEYLEQHLPNDDDVANNIGVAKDWLNTKIRDNSTQRSLIKALELFTSLKSLDDPLPLKQSESKLCLQDKVSLLEKVNLATGNVLDKAFEASYYADQAQQTNIEQPIDSVIGLLDRTKLSKRRVDSIVAHYTLEHIKQCPKLYLEKYDLLIGFIDSDTLEYTGKLIESLLISHLEQDKFDAPDFNPNKPEQYVEKYPIEVSEFIVDDMSDIGNNKDLAALYVLWRDRMIKKRDIKFRALCNTDKYGDADRYSLEKAWKLHISAPLTQFINTFETIIVPLEFDLQFVTPNQLFAGLHEEQHLAHPNSFHPIDIMHMFMYYEFARQLRRQEKQIVKSMLKYVHWRIEVGGFCEDE